MHPATPSAKIEPPTDSKRSKKRTKLIELSSLQMNRQGAASVNLALIGADAGMSRNAVYYYFKDRHALTAACYEESLRYLAEAIESALAVDGSALDRLASFISQVLSERGQFVAVMADLDLTRPEDAKRFEKQNEIIVGKLQSIIEAGIREKQFRRVSPALAARVLMSMLEWKRLWCAFMGHDARALIAGAGDLGRWLENGILVDQTFKLRDVPSVHELWESSVDVMDPAAVNRQRRNHLLGAASSLFNIRGIHATTIDDIAKTLGCTKGFVYHYVEDKDELIRMCYDRAFDSYQRFWEAGQRYGAGTAESMLIQMHLNAQAQLSKFPPLAIQASLADLPREYRQRSTAIWKRTTDNVRLAIEAGVAHSETDKLVDISAGAFFWLGKRCPDDYKQSSTPGDVVDLFAHGLCL